jgi:hypothetical protein
MAEASFTSPIRNDTLTEPNSTIDGCWVRTSAQQD